MSNNVYPASLPGLTFDSIRAPNFNTGVQQALTGKESRIAYQQYVLMSWELQYELLRDYVTPSDLKALVGLFIASQGKWDTFLYEDPVFNSVTSMQFGVTDGVTFNFPVTATYENTGGAGAPELIQNFNGTPAFTINRYSQLVEYLAGATRTQYYLQSNTFADSTLQNCTLVTSGFLSPDGVTDAIAMTSSTSASVQHYVAQGFTAPVAAGVYCFSIFVLAHGVSGGGDARYVYLQVNDGGGGAMQAVFDVTLGAGVVVSSAVIAAGNLTGPAPEIAACGNYFRLSLALTKAGTLACSCYVIPSSSATSNSYSSTQAGAFIWGAQFENSAQFPGFGPGAGGVWPSMYLPTTTAVVTQDDCTLGPTGILTIAPTGGLGNIAGTKLLWSGNFYYRVRFDDDSIDFTQFLQNFWSAKKVKLRQVKL